jgi:hypothetical protein
VKAGRFKVTQTRSLRVEQTRDDCRCVFVVKEREKVNGSLVNLKSSFGEMLRFFGVGL